jgi:hypothetical protein
MPNVIDLLIRLVETQSANRKLVLDECVEPLKQELERLHTSYIENFSRYRSEILKTGVTLDFEQWFNHDQDICVSRRAQLAGLLPSLVSVSDKRLDGHERYIRSFVGAVRRYLDFDDLPDATSHLALLVQSRMVSMTNPTYTTFRLQLSDAKSESARKLLVEFIDMRLSQLQERYQDIQGSYSQLRSFLLC